MAERGHIMRALDLSAEADLTLVAAPAGYGKTTAVRSWCGAWMRRWRGSRSTPATTIRLLWRYVATAVDRVRPGLGRGALRRLSGRGPIEVAVDELMNGIAA